MKINFHIDSRLPYISLIGPAIKALCIHYFCCDMEAADMELCVVEAVTNCIKHAYRNKAGGEVIVEMEIRPTCLSFTIKDFGSPISEWQPSTGFEFDPNDVDTIPESGMGLAIIHRIMDEVRYVRVDQTNQIIMKKYKKYGNEH